MFSKIKSSYIISNDCKQVRYSIHLCGEIKKNVRKTKYYIFTSKGAYETENVFWFEPETNTLHSWTSAEAFWLAYNLAETNSIFFNFSQNQHTHRSQSE